MWRYDPHASPLPPCHPAHTRAFTGSLSERVSGIECSRSVATSRPGPAACLLGLTPSRVCSGAAPRRRVEDNFWCEQRAHAYTCVCPWPCARMHGPCAAQVRVACKWKAGCRRSRTRGTSCRGASKHFPLILAHPSHWPHTKHPLACSRDFRHFLASEPCVGEDECPPPRGVIWRAVAEHVWEHLTLEQAVAVLRIIHTCMQAHTLRTHLHALRQRGCAGSTWPLAVVCVWRYQTGGEGSSTARRCTSERTSSTGTKCSECWP